MEPLSINPSPEGSYTIKVKGFEDQPIKFAACDIKTSIGESEARTFVRLEAEDQSLLIKIPSLAEKLGITEDEITNHRGPLNELIQMGCEAKHYRVSTATIRDYQDKDELHHLESLTDSLHLPLSEVLEAKEEGTLETLLQETQAIKDTYLEIPDLIKNGEIEAWVESNKESLKKEKDHRFLRGFHCPEIDFALSEIFVSSLNLSDEADLQMVQKVLEKKFPDDKEKITEGIAHWINTKKIPLEELDLTLEEFNKIAPHLLYVSIGEKFPHSDEEIQELLKNCSNLYRLFIRKSSNMKELGELSPSLRELYCSVCTSLISLDLTGCSSLEKLDCSLCFALTSLDLTGCSSLKELNCSFSPALISLNLTDCSSLENLNCSDCSALTTLGDTLPNTLETFNFRSCPELSDIPQVPATATVYSDDSRFVSYQVDPDKLEKEPVSVLLALGEELLSGNPFPNIIYLDPITKQPDLGIDCGGLRRQLVADLFENLFKENSGFAFTEELVGKLPTLEEGEDTKALRTLGRIMGLCIGSSLLTGAHLKRTFFEALLKLKDEEIDQPLKEIQKKIYCNLQGFDETINIDVKDHLEETPVAYPVLIVAKELKDLLDDRWRMGVDELILKVQGQEVSKETLLKKMQFNNDTAKEYFDPWIEKNPQKLADLVQFITGSRTLSRPIYINVFASRDKDSLPISHTCSEEFEMPAYPNYEIFEKKLEQALTALKTFGAA